MDDEVRSFDPRLDAAEEALLARDESLAAALAQQVVNDSLDALISGLMILVGVHGGRRDWESALDVINALKVLPVADDEFHLMVAANAAWVLGHLGRVDEALEEADAALNYAGAEAPDSRLLLNVAYAYSLSGDRQRALELILTASDLDPADPDIAYDRACHLTVLGRTSEGLEALEQALSLLPAKVEAAVFDDDFDSLRHSPDHQEHFAALIKRYQTWGS